MAIPILQKKPEVTDRERLMWLNTYNERHMMAVPCAVELNPAGDLMHYETLVGNLARLVDVCPIDAGQGQKSLSRVFMLTEAGIARKAELAKKFEAN